MSSLVSIWCSAWLIYCHLTLSWTNKGQRYIPESTSFWWMAVRWAARVGRVGCDKAEGCSTAEGHNIEEGILWGQDNSQDGRRWGRSKTTNTTTIIEQDNYKWARQWKWWEMTRRENESRRQRRWGESLKRHGTPGLAFIMQGKGTNKEWQMNMVMWSGCWVQAVNMPFTCMEPVLCRVRHYTRRSELPPSSYKWNSSI